MAYYVTTPIYYVNAEPHLGHAYTTIAADILARHMRQRGEDVFFLTGTDEHGEPVAQAAERAGLTPRELADQNAPRFRDMAARVDATNDFFIRTSDEQHVRAVQEILQRVHDRGHVYAGVYEGWYCPRCADFKTEGELVDGRCPIHKIPLSRESEENYFFRLSSFQQQLERLYSERPTWVLPEARYNEARSFIDQGLNDVSLSRSSLSWGVPVPWDSDHVFYVWFDALLNYYTALTYARPGEDLTARFWPATVHVMAKDILKFHAVIWPALLMAAGLAVPDRLFIHGYLLMEEEKMSKSLGNVIDPFEAIELFGTDALRYYLFREVAFGGDGAVSPEGFETRYTTELANEYGNLASRTLAMVARYRGGALPARADGAEIGQELDGLAERVSARFDDVDISGALEEIWSGVRRLNQWIQEQAPWQLAKDPARGDRLDEVLWGLVEGLRMISILLQPYMPDSSGRLLDAVGADDRSLAAARFGAGAGGGQAGELPPLFPRVEREAQPAA